MKTRPDGSAFRRSNVAYGRQPTQPRPRNDGFHWATPRHPEKSKLTVCNWFAYFTLTNFGGRSVKVNSKVQISVILRHFDQAKRVEKSPRKRPYKAFFKICHYEKPIEKQSSKRCGFLIVHARVPIPRKGSFRLRLCRTSLLVRLIFTTNKVRP